MNKIKLLSATVINKIAAGEIIERPASAIKEMLDNSIDAGADKITISIEQGGKNLIIVDDNGYGIEPGQLPLALTRHATSKLNDDDLFNIKHMGFRGEALASIASISRLQLISKTSNHDHAYKIEVEDNLMSKVKPANLAVGTKVIIRDLFYTTPVRLKFLKQDATEAKYVKSLIKKIAIVNPKIEFNLFCDGKLALILPATKTLQERLINIVGDEHRNNIIELNYKGHELTMNGYVGLATHNFRNADYMICFVNKRLVKDSLLHKAIRIAYMDVMPKDRYPFVFINLTLPNKMVDVNVHPAKTEVRFVNEQLIKSVIIKTISQLMKTAQANTTSTLLGNNLVNRVINNQFISNNEPLQANIFSKEAITRHNYSNFSTQTPSRLKANFIPINNFSVNDSGFAMQGTSELAKTNESNEFESVYPLGLAKVQINNCFIIAENKEGLIIVDQHAAHERIIYEKYKNNIAKVGISSQRLLIAEVIYLDTDDIELLQQHDSALAKMGLIIEYNNNFVEVKALPHFTNNQEVEGLIKDIVVDLKEYNNPIAVDELFEHLYETFACHTSIRAGKKLSIAEMNELLRQIENTPMASQCNHGRPSFVKVGYNDINKLFGRI